jgi:hypothetical protein
MRIRPQRKLARLLLEAERVPILQKMCSVQRLHHRRVRRQLAIDNVRHIEACVSGQITEARAFVLGIEPDGDQRGKGEGQRQNERKSRQIADECPRPIHG